MSWRLGRTFIFVSLMLSVALPGKALAFGERAEVFEESVPAAIWDHTTSFYMRLSLKELGGIQNPTFIWAGFKATATDAHAFTGELVVNDLEPNERRFPATAKVIHSTQDARYFFIQVRDDQGAVIKELFVKGHSH